MAATKQGGQNDGMMRKGGDFLLVPTGQGHMMTPERFGPEQKEFKRLATQFMQQQVLPHAEALEHKKEGLMAKLLRDAAGLGFCMAEIPEAYGGLGLDKTTCLLIAESLTHYASFAVTFGAHTGIGSLPILYYGTPEQRQKYLQKLATGEWIGAYALSEPGSGSDALGASAKAVLNREKTHYILNGTKAWITNAGWADLFTVFAQVDGQKFTAFLVERTTQGVGFGAEEKKLGIHGSSTRQLLLEDVAVPVSNVLGELGKGHKIAFNILNIGRYKLGISAIGGAKHTLNLGVAYAKERKQFGKAIASFGLIRQKLTNSAMLIYAGEAMAYRLGGLLDEHLSQLDTQQADYYQQAINVVDEFTIEASVLKVFGSEALYTIADEMLQLHGGNGYSQEYPLERILRDARINRIYEGTNEINRLIIPATLLKRALKGQLPLMDHMGQIMQELADTQLLPRNDGTTFGAEKMAVDLSKRAVVYAASYAAQKYMDDLKEKQALLGVLSDCMIELNVMDAALHRAMQAETTVSAELFGQHSALARLICFNGRANVFQQLRRIATMMADGEELDALYQNLSKLDQRYRIDYMGLQDQVASKLIEQDGYRLSDG